MWKNFLKALNFKIFVYLYTRRWQVLHRKSISLLTSLKVSSLAFKCVFYRPENNAKQKPMELNFKSQEMQKWSIPTNVSQRGDWNMGIWGYLSRYHIYYQSYGYVKNGSNGFKMLVTTWAKISLISFRKWYG